jgi:hypothetical protein
MKFPSLNPHYRAALALFIMAGILVTTAVLTTRNDLTSAMLVVAGLVCLLTGIFFTTLTGSDPMDLRYLSLFPVQGSVNLTRVCADLGIQGNAYLVPKGRDGRARTMQFLPVTVYKGSPLPMDSFVTGYDAAGILMEPSCAPLLQLLRERDRLVISPDMTALHELVRELGVEVLEVAEKVHSSHEEDIITITMDEYRLINGCRAMIQVSPKCCISNPCPVCSLYATVFAEGTGRVIQIERCAPDPKLPTITAVFSVLPE